MSKQNPLTLSLLTILILSLLISFTPNALSIYSKSASTDNGAMGNVTTHESEEELSNRVEGLHIDLFEKSDAPEISSSTAFSEDFEGAFPGDNWLVGDSNSNNGEDYWDDTSYRSYGGSWSGWCADIGSQTSTTTLFYEDFEGVFPDVWIVGDSNPDSGEDYWDDTSYRSYQGSWSAWCADMGTKTTTVTIFVENFEGAWPGSWIVGDSNSESGEDYWGDYYDSVHPALEGYWDGYCADEGSHPSGCGYDDNMDAYMFRDVDLSSYSSVTFSYWYWLDCEPDFDYLYVIYYDSTDSSWHFVDPHTGNSNGWQYSSVSIPTTATSVGLHFYSDSSVCNYEGAYVDQVQLTGTSEVPNNSIHEYDNDMYAYMYRSVSLSGYSSATLSYWYWLDCESGFDKLYVIYYDGADSSWHYIDEHTGNSGGWQYSSVSIPTTATYVGLHFVSDSSICSYEGAYVDEVTLTAVADIPNTDLHTYDNYMDAYMVRKYVIDASSWASATLSYRAWYQTESSYDYCQVIVTPDAGANWYYIGEQLTGTSDWSYHSLSIPSTYLTSQFSIGFMFHSDSSIHDYEGVYLDDIILEYEEEVNNSPILSEGYIDGENAWWGYPDTTYQFLVKYTDVDGDPAVTRECWVYDYGQWQSFTMDHLAGDPINGEWFTVYLTDFSCGTHNCYFHFTDELGADAYYPEIHPGYLTFTVIEPGSDLYCLPAGSKRTDPTDPSTDGTKLLTSISLNGGGQTVTVNPGDTITVSCTYQVWSNVNPNEIDQLFFIYSWTSSWPPSNSYYHPVYDDIPGLYPGYSGSDTFTLEAPSTDGVYYLYWCSGACYTMEDAVAQYDQQLTTPAHAKIIVGAGEPDIHVSPLHLDFYVEASSSPQDFVINEITTSSTTTINLQYHPSGLTSTEVMGYDLLFVQGSDGFITNPGEPCLPTRTVCVLVPPDVEVSVSLNSCESTIVEGNFRILPAQKPRSNISDFGFTSANPAIYSLDCEWPYNVFETVGFRQIREYRILVLRLFPLSYIPRRGKVIFNSAIELEISFNNKAYTMSSWKKSEFFDNMVKGVVLNPGDLNRFYSIEYSDSTEVNQNPVKYVIVTPESFETAAQSLADWKTSRGITAEVFTVEYITSAYSGVDTQEKIRNFLIDCYNSWGIEWVLLAGDVDQVPARMVYCPDGYDPDGDYVPCDYYYADLTGDWDSNGNGLWGETSDAVDWAADVFIGRLPAQTSSELQNIVSKIMNYEQNPPSGDWTSRMLFAGAYSNYENEDGNGWPKTDEAKLKELIRTNLLPDGYSYYRLYEKAGVDPSDYPCESPLTEENVETALNSGYLLANFAGHGNNYGIYRKVWVSDSNNNGIPESSEISWYNLITKSASYSNDMKLFLAYGDACSSAEIDVSESFGEYIVKLSNNGAIGYIGATRVSWYALGWDLGQGYNQELDYRYWQYFFDPSSEMKPGAALYMSKLWYANTYGTTGSAHRKDLFTYLLLGDPELEMPIGKPIVISNVGNADLEVTSITCDQPWLSVFPPCPPSFTVSPGESQTVLVRVDSTGLSFGVYYGNIQIYSNDPDENPVTVTVTLYVEDTTGPPSPTVSSSTHPNQDDWFSNSDPCFQWETPTDPSGIKGYSYILDNSPSTVPDNTIVTTENSVCFTNVADGEWWFHIRAVDNADNWGSPSHYRIRIDTKPPSCSITHSKRSAYVYVQATDPTPGSGVYAIYIRIDGGSWVEHSGAGPIEITLTGTGSHIIEVYSVDNAHPANTESPPKVLTVHYLTVNTDPSGLDNPTGEGWYDEGSDASIYVDEVPYYEFNYWYLDGQSSIPYSTTRDAVVTMDAPHTATAKFTPISLPFEDDFESGDFSRWTGISRSSGETATVVDTLAYQGVYSAMFTSNGNALHERAYCYKAVSSSTELYARGYFYMSASGITENGDRFYLIVFRADGNGVAFAGWRQTGGVVKWSLIVRDGTGWVTAYSATSPSLNRWYCVELHWKEDATNGLGEMWVNGNLVCSVSGKNTATFGDVNSVSFGLPDIVSCGNTIVYADDAVISTTYIGPKVIFSDGFESGDFNAWTGTHHSPGETLTVVSTTAYQGTYSGKFTSNSNSLHEHARCYQDITPLSEIYVRGYFYVSTSGITDNGDRFYFIVIRAGGQGVAFAGWRKTGGVIKWSLIIRDGAGWVTAYSTTTPSLNQWYCVEIHWIKSNSGGAELWVDGVLVCSVSGKNTAAFGDAGRVEFGLPDIVGCGATQVYGDCAVISTAYIGPEPRILFEDGFESGDFSKWTGTSTSSGETAAVVSTLAYQGVYSAMFTSNGDALHERARCYKSIAPLPELYARGYFYVSTFGITDNNDRFYFIVFRAGTNGVAFAGWRQVGGTVKWNLLIRDGTGWVSAYSTATPSLDKWYCVELHWVEGSSNGGAELWVDGTLVCSISGKNTAYYGDVDRIEFGLADVVGCGSTTVYADCAAISTTSIGTTVTSTSTSTLTTYTKTINNTERRTLP